MYQNTSKLCNLDVTFLLKCINVIVCQVLEGREEDELPERILGGGRIQFPNTVDPPHLLPLASRENTSEEC